MTEIEAKALALVNEVRVERRLSSTGPIDRRIDWDEALCRAIEQHEAFKQQVSEFALGVKGYMASVKAMAWQSDCDKFIIAKPVDPFVALVGEAVWNDPNEPDAVDCAASILAALAARGLTITETKE